MFGTGDQFCQANPRRFVELASDVVVATDQLGLEKRRETHKVGGAKDRGIGKDPKQGHLSWHIMVGFRRRVWVRVRTICSAAGVCRVFTGVGKVDATQKAGERTGTKGAGRGAMTYWLGRTQVPMVGLAGAGEAICVQTGGPLVGRSVSPYDPEPT